MRRFKTARLSCHNHKTGDVVVQTKGTVPSMRPIPRFMGNATVSWPADHLSGMSTSNERGCSVTLINDNVMVTGVVLANGITLQTIQNRRGG